MNYLFMIDFCHDSERSNALRSCSALTHGVKSPISSGTSVCRNKDGQMHE